MNMSEGVYLNAKKEYILVDYTPWLLDRENEKRIEEEKADKKFHEEIQIMDKNISEIPRTHSPSLHQLTKLNPKPNLVSGIKTVDAVHTCLVFETSET